MPLDGGAEPLRAALAALAAATAGRGPHHAAARPRARTGCSPCPFRDRARLADTAPLELLGQLPLSADDAVVATRPLGPLPAAPRCSPSPSGARSWRRTARASPSAGLPATRIDLAPLPALQLVPDDDVALVVGGRARERAGGAARGADRRPPRARRRRERSRARSRPRCAGRCARSAAPRGRSSAGPDASRVQAALAAALEGSVDVLTPPAALAGAASAEDVVACAVAVGLVLGEGRHATAGVTLAGDGGDLPGRWRRAAALAAAALVLGVVDVALVRTALVRREAALARAAEAVAAAALPGTPGAVPPAPSSRKPWRRAAGSVRRATCRCSRCCAS